jgi:hypothetical protein
LEFAVLGVKVSLNGKALCTAALDGQIQAFVGFGGHAGEPSVSVQGYRDIAPSKSESLEWAKKQLQAGDVVTIELVTTADSDKPRSTSIFDSSITHQELEDRIARMMAEIRLKTEGRHQQESTPSPEPSLRYCAFCGKDEHEVVKLIPGPNVFICDECIALCNQILRQKS